MLSNEEIVARIQAGERELVADLWKQIEGFVAWKADKVIRAIDGKSGVVFDDLYNSGYLAMVAAIETYRSENCAFTTWLMYYLKTEFAEVTGIRTRRDRNDPLRGAVSLSTPIGDKEDSAELLDVVPDPDGTRAMEAVENATWLEQLHETMEKALAGIPERYSEVLRLRYYENKTLSEIAETSGISTEEIRKRELRGLRELRKPRHACQLRPFYEVDYYCGSAGSGLQSFRNSGMSAQERYLMAEERRKERAQDRERERREQENRGWEALLRKLEEDENARLEERGY